MTPRRHDARQARGGVRHRVFGYHACRMRPASRSIARVGSPPPAAQTLPAIDFVGRYGSPTSTVGCLAPGLTTRVRFPQESIVMGGAAARGTVLRCTSS